LIAIGALGGSGTRAVAQILIQSGIFMGNNLNKPLDNLLFTGLFKNPTWYKKASQKNKLKRFKLFAKYMSGDSIFLHEKIFISLALISNKQHRSGLKTYSNLFFSNPIQRNLNWGWKEPNTLIYIPEIAEFYKGIKYIHVIRHGLDMAFSRNTQQLQNWGFKFGVEFKANDNQNDVARKQLDYWIKANDYAINTGHKLLGNSFYLLNHQALCERPEEEIKKLLTFLKIYTTKELLQQLKQIPVIQNSYCRYRNHDISIFTNEQLMEVKKMGFTI
jgi:hypothetical protein